MDDQELVKQILEGNTNAFKYLVLQHQRLVLHVVGRIVRQQEEVEDICQDVFMKVFQKIKKFRGDSKLSTWIATIAYNTSISHIRKLKRGEEPSFDEMPALIETKADEKLVGKNLERKEIELYLLEYIEQLPVQYRTVITLFHLEEFSYKEIEKITGMPEGTIKSYLSRARKMLREKMEKFSFSEKTNIFADYVEQGY